MRRFLIPIFILSTFAGPLFGAESDNAILLTDPAYAGFIKLHGMWTPWNGNPSLYQESQPVSTIEFRAKLSGFHLAGACYGAMYTLYVDGVRTAMRQFPNTAPTTLYSSVTFDGLDAEAEHLYEIACVSGSSAVSTITPIDGSISTSVTLPDKPVDAYFGDSIEAGQGLPDTSYTFMYLHSHDVGRVAVLVGAGGRDLVGYGENHTGDIPLPNRLAEVFVRYGTNDSLAHVADGTFLTSAVNLLNNLRTHVGPNVQITQLPCLPEVGFAARNAVLRTAVEAAGVQANLRFIDDTANFDCTAGVDTLDGRHPNTAGSIVLANNLTAATNPPPVAPVISRQPAPQTVPMGNNATLSVDASGGNPLTYQWQLNGADIGGQTSPILSLSKVLPEQAGIYTVKVSNAEGSVSSVGAPLSVQADFTQWTAAFFTPQQLSDPAISGAAATSPADGVPNLLKFFCDIPPGQPMTASDQAALPVVAVEADGDTHYLRLTYRRNAGALGLKAEIQTATSLAAADWQTVTPDIIENLSPDPSTGDPRVRVKIDITQAPLKFIRLQVAIPSPQEE